MLEVEEGRRVAPVLEKMIDLLTAEENEGMTFGEALKRASRHTMIPVETGSPAEVALLSTAFRIIAGKRLPGAADA